MKPELPPRPMTPNEIEAYRRDGAVCLRGLYSPAWVTRIEAALDEIIEEATFDLPGITRGVRADAYSWMTKDAVRDFVLQGPSAYIAQQAFGSRKVNFFYDQVFVKLALAPDPTPWHHDASFWPIEGEQIASLWTSVDAVDAESSALEFIAGSHRWDKLWKPVGLGGVVASTEALDALPDIDAERDKYDIISWALEPGDAILFHARTVHGSRGNKSPDRKRRAITTRWCGDDVVFRPTDEGRLPMLWPHGLEAGAQLSGPLFPRVLPDWDLEALADRLKGPVYPDPERMARAFEQLSTAERVPVKM